MWLEIQPLAGHRADGKSTGRRQQHGTGAQRIVKNKTLATWLAFIGGPMGLHLFYLRGLLDWRAWLLPIPTAAGLYGLQRVQQYGLDDQLSWLLIPLLGFTIAGCAMTSIRYGLMPAAQWNARHNPNSEPEAPAGRTNWLTVGALVAALLVGTTVLMASLVFSFQHYFEYQIEQARLISQ